jgi:hypothetical protein
MKKTLLLSYHTKLDMKKTLPLSCHMKKTLPLSYHMKIGEG